MESGYLYSFPAVKGVQAGRPFYVAMCPLRLVAKIFVFDEEEVPPDLRAQRILNRARVPEIVSYLVNNPTTYVLSALTASIDGPAQFEPFSDQGPGSTLGTLSVAMAGRILINDGQHRRAAIEAAIKHRPELGSENVPVLFFVDNGLQRSQQMFADLNKYAVRPSYSLSTLYDFRDPGSDAARYLAQHCPVFMSLTEMEKSTISNRSTKLFTLSSIKHATRALLRKQRKDEISDAEKLLAKDYWEAVAEQITEWRQARQRTVSTAELRQRYIHSHGIALHALGIAGASLLSSRPKDWKIAVRKLRTIDWSRSNAKIWEGRAMVHGRISKASFNVQRTANLLKRALNLSLTEKEKFIEKGIA